MHLDMLAIYSPQVLSNHCHLQEALYPPAVPVSSIFRKQANTRCIPRSICAAFPKQTAAPVSDKSRSRAYGGVGLGLSLVWEIVLLHNGTVKAEKSDKNGTVMLVTLPKKQTND